MDFSKVFSMLKEKLDPTVIEKILEHFPILDLVPLVKKAWDGLPEEKKLEVIQNLLVAGAKAAAGGSGKVNF